MLLEYMYSVNIVKYDLPWYTYKKHSCMLFLCVGILYEDGTIANECSIQRLAEVALAYAKAGNYTFIFNFFSGEYL